MFDKYKELMKKSDADIKVKETIEAFRDDIETYAEENTKAIEELKKGQDELSKLLSEMKEAHEDANLKKHTEDFAKILEELIKSQKEISAEIANIREKQEEFMGTDVSSLLTVEKFKDMAHVMYMSNAEKEMLLSNMDTVVSAKEEVENLREKAGSRFPL